MNHHLLPLRQGGAKPRRKLRNAHVRHLLNLTALKYTIPFPFRFSLQPSKNLKSNAEAGNSPPPPRAMKYSPLKRWRQRWNCFVKRHYEQTLEVSVNLTSRRGDGSVGGGRILVGILEWKKELQISNKES